MTQKKTSIHTTINADASKVLDRHVKDLGSKKTVIERALLNLESNSYSRRHKSPLPTTNIKRINTNIPGFDNLVEGGIPKGSSTIITGPPGTGKTTFCMHMLKERIENNDKGIMFSFEEDTSHIIQQCSRFGWDFGKYIDDGYLEIISMSLLNPEEITHIIESHNPDIVVLDSLNIIASPEKFRKKQSWRMVLKKLKSNNITSLFITEKYHGLDFKTFDDYDFLGDGIIFFDTKITNDVNQTITFILSIQKMRATAIDSSPKPFVLDNNGISVYNPTGLTNIINP